MHTQSVAHSRREAGCPHLAWIRGRRGGLPTSCTLALWALSTAPAAPASPLAGTTLCLSPTTSVFVSGVPGPGPYRWADRLYAEMKSLFRAQGVRFAEAPVCKTSPAALTLFLDATPLVRETGMETRVSGRVDGGLSNSRLLWSGVQYGRADASEAELKGRLLEDTRALLNRFVGDWKAANR